ncbi:MAG TPA: nicotinate-nucleotide--dimethylbenzimidazole phosphoribosyltransferase [Noviherbaspirillum sp.]|uniref:nicotinate-nucleotide--dimethylbenzimidazole phosphoribosyltransferase n=1 Tax=Noviherbaspirillum sp. TaxID=1926288 RepID=UPI002B4A10E5|nr:nicotinate-nucleotide--dimethylbenzimidazole phosphoribosyltransferase [Noviherbaspirillum sp.]HJV86780.1 nicotinate-nucleotide--dimethylbenzimidazole phosphoribosyltransferase [Noviherbaspirillum sp.]
MHIPHIESIQNPMLSARLDAVIDNKTKPRGSLGMLESLAKQVGLIQKTTRPALVQPTILVFAGDHGIVAENVSAFPQSVTWQMVENFLAEGAAINVFARQNTIALKVIDAGVNHDFGSREGLINRKVGPGTRNFVDTSAMTKDECARAMQHGMALVKELEGNVIGFGEMGIGNTTPAAAILHKITGMSVAECTGAGTGLTTEGISHKQRVIERAVAHHEAVVEPLDILATFGGYEIAMMAGAMLQAAEQRMVLLIDGFIVTSALMIAARINPAVLDYCVFSHCSDEQGHKAMLRYFDARPLLQLSLRLGEGTGGALAYPLLQAAVNFLNEMATFESAQVSEQVA